MCLRLLAALKQVEPPGNYQSRGLPVITDSSSPDAAHREGWAGCATCGSRCAGGRGRAMGGPVRHQRRLCRPRRLPGTTLCHHAEMALHTRIHTRACASTDHARWPPGAATACGGCGGGRPVTTVTADAGIRSRLYNHGLCPSEAAGQLPQAVAFCKHCSGGTCHSATPLVSATTTPSARLREQGSRLCSRCYEHARPTFEFQLASI